MMAIKSVQRVHPNTHCSGIDKSNGLQRVDTEGALVAVGGCIRLDGWVGTHPMLESGPFMNSRSRTVA
mgnify:CR=1 FL=1